MRELIQKYGAWIVVGLVVVAVAVAAFNMTRTAAKPPPASGTMAFYVDEETNDESVHAVTEIPPLMGKEGKPTVCQAFKFTRDGGKTVVLGYLLKYTPEGKEALEKANQTGAPADISMNEHRLVRSPEKGSEWFPSSTPQGEAVMTAVNTLVKGEGRLEMVSPK